MGSLFERIPFLTDLVAHIGTLNPLGSRGCLSVTFRSGIIDH